MLFNSAEFLIFLPIVFAVYWLLNKNRRLQNLWVVTASYLFYGWWDYRFLALIAFTTITSWWTGVMMEGDRRRRLWLWLSVGVNLGILGLFKYYDFFAQSFADVFLGGHGDKLLLNLVLPVGISFYTFQALSYSIDIYKRKIEPTHDIIAYFAYVSFFPQLVAGPIERATNLLPQFLERRRFDYNLAVDGMRQMLWGFFMKMAVADRCGLYVDQVWGHYAESTGPQLVLAAMLFSIQIYGDFAGYSNIAIGCAKLFGIRLKPNFKTPYFSRDTGEFWRRWHISLSSWLRDYLYISLGGNRKGKVRQYINLIITMFLGGLWHGAAWNFILWGMLHGVALAFHKAYRSLLGRAKTYESHGWRRFFAVLITFHFVCLCWIFFRQGDFNASLDMLSQIATNFSPQVFPQLISGYWLVFILMLLGYALHFVPDSWERGCVRFVTWLPLVGKALLMVAVIYLVIQMKSAEIQPFIYFQF